MEAPAAEADAGGAGAAFPSRSSTRTSTCSWWTSRPAWSRIRRRGTAGRRSPRRWPAAAAGGEHPERAGIVHRLDRDTSGLLVVARSEEAHAALQRMMKAREVTREYIALVEGHPDAESGTIDAPIGRDRGNRTVMSTRTDRARSAVTHFEVLERLPRTTLLRVRLETGRTHQIRAHLAAIGHPVCGDPPIRGPRERPQARPRAPVSARFEIDV